MTESPSLLLVGCGKMGGALLRGWLQNKIGTVVVIEPSSLPAEILVAKSVTHYTSPDKIPAAFKPDAIILAIKPQQMAETLPVYARYKDAVFLSIAAGQTLAQLGALLGGPHALIRAMPNLPASIGAGISAMIANQQASVPQCHLCDRLLQAAGAVVWVQNEQLLNAVTALSGSGPAYVFALVEAMAAAGASLDLPAPLAAQLARQTIIGSGAMLAQLPDSATSLREAVTSPGGTTEAALAQLLGPEGLTKLMQKTMAAAAKRAEELAS